MESKVVWLRPPRALDAATFQYRFQRALVDVSLRIDVDIQKNGLQVKAQAEAAALAWKKMHWEAESFRDGNQVRFSWKDHKQRGSEIHFQSKVQIGGIDRDLLAPTEIFLSVADAFNPHFDWYVAPFEIEKSQGLVIFRSVGEGRLSAKSFSLSGKDQNLDQILENGIFTLFEQSMDPAFEVQIGDESVFSLGFKVPVVGAIRLEQIQEKG